MGSFSIWHWLLVLVVILILFGAGKLPKVAGDLASGIKNFRKGMKEEPGDEAKDSASIQQQPTPTAQSRTAQGSTNAATGANAGEKH